MATNNPSGAGKSGPRRRIQAADLAALAGISGRITALEPQKGDPDRCSVYVDGGFCLGLHREVAVLAGLKVGRQVDGKRLLEAALRDQERRAFDDGLLYLSGRDRSRQEVERRLRRRYPPELTAAVVARLAGMGWLDDAAVAQRYVAARQGYGASRLLRDLLRRGIARELALAAIDQGLGRQDRTEELRELAGRRLAAMGSVDRVTAERRLGAFLARRGFDFEAINRVLGPLLADLPLPQAGARGGWSGGGLRSRRKPGHLREEEKSGEDSLPD